MTDNAYRLTPVTSGALSLIRWPLGVCIVAVHWFSLSSIATASLPASPEDLGFYMGLVSFVRAFIADCSVGMFFFISGYLFFSGAPLSREAYRSKLSRRVHTLVLPYLAWNLLFVGALFLWQIPAVASALGLGGLPRADMGAGEFFLGFFGYGSHLLPHNANLWFIRNLIVGILCAPLLLPLIRRKGAVALLCVLAALYAWFTYRSMIFWSGLFSALLFFNGGAWFSVRHIDLASAFRRIAVPAALTFVGCGLALLAVQNSRPAVASLLKTVEMFAAIVFAIDLAVRLVEGCGMKAVPFLTAATFFMFAFHPLVMGPLQVALVSVFHPSDDLSLTLTYLCGFVILLGLVHIVFFILRLLTPRVLSFLVGKRLRT